MRARNIKPGFFQNEYLAQLSPTTRILFIGLWCLADREGRLEDRPERIRINVLPYHNGNVDEMLQELCDSPDKFIVRYAVDGKKYIEITNFTEHQNPHPREPQSLIPPFTEQDKVKDVPSRVKVLPSNVKDMPSNAYTSFTSYTSDSLHSDSLHSDTPYTEAEEIIGYLNEKAGTKYSHKTDATQKQIKARLKSGYSIDDFKTVIDKKCVEWIGTDWEKFIRPSTLFSPANFESYLNQKVKTNENVFKKMLREGNHDETRDY